MHVDAALELVQHALRTQRLGHGYLITGPTRGTAGELALRMLQLLFCTSAEQRPCNRCDRCRQVRARTWADVFWLNPEKKSRVIGAEQMRTDLLLELTQTSLAGGWKAGVIVGADRMSEAAANILLKTLEEPPPNTLFLLLTDAPQSLLSTIVSRCQRIEVDDAPLLDEPWRGRLIALLSAPHLAGPLPALALAGQLACMLKELKETAEAEVLAERKAESGVLEEDKDAAQARISARYREYRTGVLRAMLRWYRDLLVLRAGGAETLLRHPGHAALLRERANRLTLAQALANVQGMEELERQFERSLPEEMVLAYWLDRLAGGGAAPAVA